MLPAHQGDLLLHCGKLVHAGAQIHSGTRYLVVGFVDVLAGVSGGAYSRYVVGLGRLSQARRLLRARPRSPRLRHLAAPEYQRSAKAALQYELAARALEPEPGDNVVGNDDDRGDKAEALAVPLVSRRLREGLDFDVL